MNPADYVVLAVVAVLLFFAVRAAYRRRNRPCGGSCSGCPYHDSCTRNKKDR